MPAEEHGRTWLQPRPPEPGHEVWITRNASVQFARQPSFVFRVISVCPQPTYPGWVWLTGYQLDGQGHAVARREIYVRLAGLRRASRSDARLRS